MRITKRIQEKIKRMRGESDSIEAVNWKEMYFFVLSSDFETLRSENPKEVYCVIRQYNSPDFENQGKVLLETVKGIENAIIPIYSHVTEAGYFFVTDVCTVMHGEMVRATEEFQKWLNDNELLYNCKYIKLN